MDHKYSTYLLFFIGGIVMIGLVFGLDGFGTEGHLARWVNGEVLNNSNIVDDGSSINISLPLYVQGVRINSSGSVVNNYYNITNNTVNNYTQNESKYPINLTVTSPSGNDETITLCLFNATCFIANWTDNTGSNNYPTNLSVSSINGLNTVTLGRSGLTDLTTSFLTTLNYTSSFDTEPLQYYNEQGLAGNLSDSGAVYNSTEGNYMFNGSGSFINTTGSIYNYEWNESHYISFWILVYNTCQNQRSIGRSVRDNIFYDSCNLLWQFYNGTSASDYLVVSNIGQYIGNNTWGHIVATSNGSVRYIYINGILRATDTNISIFGTIKSTNEFTIGGTTKTAGYWSNGSFDNIMTGNRSLSSSEVLALYNSGRGGSPVNMSGLILWAPFSNFTAQGGIDTSFNTTNKDNYGLNTPTLDERSIVTNPYGSIYPNGYSLRNSNVTYYPLEYRSEIGLTGNLTNFGAVYNTTEGNYMFDGTNDYITSPINMSDITVGYISLWFMPFGTSSSFNRIISAEGTSAANGTAITYRASTGYIYPAYSPSSQITGFYVGNNLTHVVMTWNGTNVSVYIDGQFRASITQINNAYARLIYIGRAYYSASGYFNGSVDNLQVGNRSLSSVEVLAQYNAGRGGSPVNMSGLVLWAPFDSQGEIRPVCNVDRRGQLWNMLEGSGEDDYTTICSRSANNTYYWRTIG